MPWMLNITENQICYYKSEHFAGVMNISRELNKNRLPQDIQMFTWGVTCFGAKRSEQHSSDF